MRWTTKDARRVRAILDHITSKTEGGAAGFATSLKLSRQVVNNWRRRGRVPIAHHAAVIRSAAPEISVTRRLRSRHMAAASAAAVAPS